MGQVFTPYHISEFMADITLSGLGEITDTQGYASINDSAVGAGVMLIAVANKAEKLLHENLNWQDHILFTGQDLSLVAAQMAYIQIALLGCAGYIKVGNTLTTPIHTADNFSDYWFTPMYFSDVWQMRRIFHPSDTLIDPYKE